MASPNVAGTSGAKESSLTALIARLERREIPHFYQVMTKTAVTQMVSGPLAYALEFPIPFVKAHGNKCFKLSIFQRVNSGQVWPVDITWEEDAAGMSEVFAYGPGGWKAFVVDNDIQVGDTLVFALVGLSTFTIDIIKAAPWEDHEEAEDPSLRDPSSQNIKEAPVSGCNRCQLEPPQFTVKVAPTDVNQLRLPGNFCERFQDMLPSRDWELTGPSGTIVTVEAAESFCEAQQKMQVHLKSGWQYFFVDNELRIGDLLEFSLVAPVSFLVDVHRVCM